jgi:hypothetical protein
MIDYKREGEKTYRKFKTATKLTEGSITNDLLPLHTKKTLVVILTRIKKLLNKSVF